MVWSAKATLVKPEAGVVGQVSGDCGALVEAFGVVAELQHRLSELGGSRAGLVEVLERVVEVMGVEKASVMLWDERLGGLVVKLVHGLEDMGLQDAINAGVHVCRVFEVGQGLAGRVYESGVPQMVSEIDGDGRFLEPRGWTRSIVCLPLVWRGKVRGVLNVSNRRAGIFGRRDVMVASVLAGLVALGLDRVELYQMAMTDALTGVCARRRFQKRLDDELRRSARFGRPVSLVLLDIDHFKGINDTYGHQVGDAVLKEVSRVLQENLREKIDLVGRLGGDEFGLLLPETDARGARVVAERLLERVRQVVVWCQGRAVKVTLSMGVATCSEEARTQAVLVERADEALYGAKRQGRDGVVCWGQSRPGLVLVKPREGVGEVAGRAVPVVRESGSTASGSWSSLQAPGMLT